MRIAIFSDLHLEFAPFEPPKLDADVVVLAGDIAPKLNGLRFASSLAARMPVLYVLGNHEYYGTHTQLPRKLKSLAAANVHVLDDDERILGGVRFLGCTLWTDFELTGDRERAQTAAVGVMNDYVRIRSAEFGFKRLRPIHTYRKHLESRAWLEAKLSEPFAGLTVVVTHHAPSVESLTEAERSDPVSSCYATRLDDLVRNSGASLWIHGHTHRNVDYTLGSTRVLTNQRGYSDEPVSGFDAAGKTVELTSTTRASSP